MLALTAKHADIWNTRGSVEDAAERSRLLDEKCREIGRDPQSLSRSIWPHQHPWESLDNVKQVIESYREHGFSHFIFSWPPDDKLDVMRDFAKQLG
jgi:alkanesulfonate monooxygenase SsuD/methylene tetrahydromethanopterin reductase-like flavin-dependent oxidoreductase (luciferase family)